MTNQKLTALPPKSMKIEDQFEWIKNRAMVTAEAAEAAEEYFKTLKKHHKNMAKLMSELNTLREKNPPNAIEEAQAIVDAAVEVSEAIIALNENQFKIQEEKSVDDWESEITSSEGGKEAIEELNREAERFLAKYTQHKARLGLSTQQDVADLTGIDRRYISEIEKGKHKPQFKTLKKIADAFGISVTDLA